MTDPLASRTAPNNRDAECTVIGGVLRDPDVLPDVLAVTNASEFYFDAHQKVFAAIVDLSIRGKPIDLVMLFEELRARKQVEDISGAPYLAELWDCVPTGAAAIYHANLVHEAYLFRSVIHAANELLRDAYSPTMPAAELIANAERRLFEFSTNAVSVEPRHVGNVVNDILAKLDERIAGGERLAGLSVGYDELDGTLGGLIPGEVIVIGARPSVGKTALAWNICERVAERGTPALFFSLEMPASEVTERLVSMESGVPMAKMKRPRELTRDNITNIFQACSDRIQRLPLYVDDTAGQTAARVASVSRQMVRRRGIKLLVIDYLQLMRPDNPRDNRTRQIGDLALNVKWMARGLNIPVILLAQLNRDNERARRKPTMSDLRDSGEIEQHADRVLLLHREEDNCPQEQPMWPIDVIIAKNRNGPTGDVKLAYRRPVLRFENASLGL